MKFDAVVAGAGSAGTAAALALARTGMKVALLEGRRRSKGGARWINGVPPWFFDRLGVARPRDRLSARPRAQGSPWTERC